MNEDPPKAPTLDPRTRRLLKQPTLSKAGLFPRFEEEFAPVTGPLGPLQVIEHLLKRPATLVYEVSRGQRMRLLFSLLLLIAMLCVALYGFVVGSFAGGHQLWAVPLKAVAGLLFAATICLPSLYIFLSLFGGRHSFAETATFLGMALAMSGILLVGLAPVAWVFAQSTGAIAFMGVMHFFFVGLGLRFGMGLLSKTLSLLNDRDLGVLHLWIPVFVVVLFQVMTMLRPVIGSYKGLYVSDKVFFLAHWLRTLGG